MGDLVDDAEHRIANVQRLLRIALEVDVLDFADAGDLSSGLLGDNADRRFRAGQGGFPVEVFLGTELVRPDLSLASQPVRFM
jgi:hypothetical protein